MKGNYYYFAPLLDEKGKQVVRHARIDEWVDLYNNPYPTSTISRPILTMKKFDHDPFERIKEVARKWINDDVDFNFNTRFATKDDEKKFDQFLIIVNDFHKAISETVRELEAK